MGRRRGPGRLACAVLAAALLAPAATAAGGAAPDGTAPRLYAERVTEANAARRLVGGPDAVGGLGDWALGNGTLCAVVSDPSHESMLSPRGGVLVDLAHCGRDDDQWNVLQPLFDLSRGGVPDVREVGAEVDDDTARIVTRGVHHGVAFETAYALSGSEPDVLRVTTVLQRIGPGDAIPLLGDIALHGNASLRPFTFSSERPAHSVGFDHPPVDPDDFLAMARAVVDADVHVLVGGAALDPPVSYGFGLAGARRETAAGSERLPHFAVNGADFSLFAVAPQPFWLGQPGDVGLVQLAQTLLMDVVPEARVVYRRWLRMGERADVASVLDAVWPGAPRVAGRVDDPDTVIEVRGAEGAPVTLARSDRDGRFAFRVPPGAYTLRVEASGGRVVERSLRVRAPEPPPHAGAVGPALRVRAEPTRRGRDEPLDLGTVTVGRPGRLLLPGGPDAGGPMRLVLRGVDGTPDPDLGGDPTPLRFGAFTPPPSERAGHVSLAGVDSDPEWLVLPPGRYRVWATRGPEFALAQATVEVRSGETTALDLPAPTRVLDTPGWIASDLHVHSVASDDSAWPMQRRVAGFVAQGVEVVVATEHDRVVDYAPAIRALGLSARVASVVGSEITSSSVSAAVPYTAGHANAFPLPYRPEAHAGGALASEGRRLRDVAAQVRRLGGERLLQLNHPRPGAGDPDLNELFTHLSVVGEPFEPARPLTADPNRVLLERDAVHGLRDLDFDAMELMNGPDPERYFRTRADWLSLLLQGEVRTGTANSDSHRAGEILGLPRSYVRVAGDEPAAFDEGEFVRALRAGRVVGTTGPWLEVRLGDAEVGDRYRGRRGTLHVAVDAAAWVPVDVARVYVNGERVAERPVEPGARLELPLAFAADAFVTVEVEGEPDETWAAVNPGAIPFAFTNPIFVDADDDGRWRAPGLEPVPATLRPPFER